MIRLRTATKLFVLTLLLVQSNMAAARPMQAGIQPQLQEQVMPWELAVQAKLLPALQIEVCRSCNLSREEISEIEKGYMAAALVAGYRIDVLATTEVHIVETGMQENGLPFARGETAGMWFRVGGPVKGESLCSVAGRLTFLILSGSR